MPSDPISPMQKPIAHELPPDAPNKESLPVEGHPTITATEAFKNSKEIKGKTKSEKFSISDFAINFAKTISDFASGIRKKILHSSAAQTVSMALFKMKATSDPLKNLAANDPKLQSNFYLDSSSKYRAAEKIMQDAKDALRALKDDLSQAKIERDPKVMKSIERRMNKLEKQLDFGQEMAKSSKRLNSTEKGLINSAYSVAKMILNDMRSSIDIDELMIPEDMKDAEPINLDDSPFNEFIHPDLLDGSSTEFNEIPDPEIKTEEHEDIEASFDKLLADIEQIQKDYEK